MFKRNITLYIGIIIGAIIFGTTGVLAGTFIAKDVTYDNSKSNINASNVQDAIDVLYTKANEGAPESYTGLYTYTPSTNTQTIYSANKKFNDNITINPIPSSYKNLTTNTTVNSSNLLNGATAYNNNGELITGNISTDCVKGTFICDSNCANGTYRFLNFKPSFFLLAIVVDGYHLGHLYITSEGFLTINKDTLDRKTTYDRYTITTSGVTINGLGSGWLNKSVDYVACK